MRGPVLFNRVNEARLGELAGEPIAKADAAFVRAHTGFAGHEIVFFDFRYQLLQAAPRLRSPGLRRREDALP